VLILTHRRKRERTNLTVLGKGETPNTWEGRKGEKEPFLRGQEGSLPFLRGKLAFVCSEGKTGGGPSRKRILAPLRCLSSPPLGERGKESVSYSHHRGKKGGTNDVMRSPFAFSWGRTFLSGGVCRACARPVFPAKKERAFLPPRKKKGAPRRTRDL